jgi:hypothetical protein
MDIRTGLALGLELSGLYGASYLLHEPIAKNFGFQENLTLTILLGISLVIWTAHAYFYFEKRSK